MKKFLRLVLKLFIVLAVLLAIAAFIGFRYFFRSEFMRNFRVTVSVEEGSVSLYEILSPAEEEFMRMIFEGEEFSFVKSVDVGRSGRFNLLSPVIPAAALIYTQRMAEFTKTSDREVFTRLFTQQEYAHFITPALEARFPLQELVVLINERGFNGTATFDLFGLNFKVSASGIVHIDPETQYDLDLKMYSARIGPFNVPRFFLDQGEQAFGEIFSSAEPYVEIMSMDYVDGGIIITFRKKTS